MLVQHLNVTADHKNNQFGEIHNAGLKIFFTNCVS